MASGTSGRRGDRNVTVRGAHIEGGAGGIHVGGDLDASVQARVGANGELAVAVDDLVSALRAHGLLAEADMADAARDLQDAARDPRVRPSVVRRALRQIEAHPAVATATPGAVTAAIETVRMITGG